MNLKKILPFTVLSCGLLCSTTKVMAAELKDSQYPYMKIEKTAAWSNKAEGIAEITVNVTEAADMVENDGSYTDYYFLLDRSGSMTLDDTGYEAEYGSNGGNSIGSLNCPCVNPDHYYKVGSKKVHLVTYGVGFTDDGTLLTDLWDKELWKGGGSKPYSSVI